MCYHVTLNLHYPSVCRLSLSTFKSHFDVKSIVSLVINIIIKLCRCFLEYLFLDRAEIYLTQKRLWNPRSRFTCIIQMRLRYFCVSQMLIVLRSLVFGEVNWRVILLCFFSGDQTHNCLILWRICFHLDLSIFLSTNWRDDKQLNHSYQ